MAKRYTDTDKWKKTFIKKLPPEYKLFWLYILDDCTVSGIWDVDIEIARIRTGCPDINVDDALAHFGDMVYPFEGGEKWFICKFPHFQYNHLRPDHFFHKKIIAELTEKGLYDKSQEHIYNPIDFGEG